PGGDLPGVAVPGPGRHGPGGRRRRPRLRPGPGHRRRAGPAQPPRAGPGRDVPGGRRRRPRLRPGPGHRRRPGPAQPPRAGPAPGRPHRDRQPPRAGDQGPGHHPPLTRGGPSTRALTVHLQVLMCNPRPTRPQAFGDACTMVNAPQRRLAIWPSVAGGAAALLVALAIWVGSRGLRYFDAALVGYATATVFLAFGVVYRYAVWVSSPPARRYLRRGWQAFFSWRNFRSLPTAVPRSVLGYLGLQTFLRARRACPRL